MALPAPPVYGAEHGKPSFANNCLLARRMIESGVRFVQLFHESWDQHGNLTLTPSKTVSTFTICTPRLCIFSALITRS